MGIRVRYGHWIPRLLKVEGIVLYPFVLFARREVSPSLFHHEWIHVRQVRSAGWLSFYLKYGSQYLRGRMRGLSHSQAYLAISFEEEAYREQGSLVLSAAEKREIGSMLES